MNSEQIISRLKRVLTHYSLTSSTFADTIDVQRSSISHLMSGRNKPSLDFILKVVDSFPEVDLYWLLKGQGNFPKKKEENTSPTLFSEKEQNLEIELKQKNKKTKKQKKKKELKIKPSAFFQGNEKNIIKVILLYDDGSFEGFNQ